ncbi:MAG: TraB/GumN family protein [Gammaproteobacteria bacterium]
MESKFLTGRAGRVGKPAAREAGRTLLPALSVATLAAALFAPSTLANGPLWAASTSQGQATLMGSVHFGSPDMYPLSQSAEERFERADRLMVELDVTALEPANVMLITQTHGMLGSGQTLESTMSADLWRRTELAAQKLRFVGVLLQSMRPWLATLTLATLQATRSGYSEELGIDLHFLKRAHESGKTVVELESFAQQVELFASMDEDAELLMLEQLVESVERGEGELKAIMEAWKRGEEAEIDRLMNEQIRSSEGGEALYTKLITERNEAMAAKIKAQLDSGGDTFVVVGAGHLVGEVSIVNNLRKLGVAVERLP